MMLKKYVCPFSSSKQPIYPCRAPLTVEADGNPLHDSLWSCGLPPSLPVSISLHFCSPPPSPETNTFSLMQNYVLTVSVYRKHFRTSYRLFSEICGLQAGHSVHKSLPTSPCFHLSLPFEPCSLSRLGMVKPCPFHKKDWLWICPWKMTSKSLE